MVESRTFPNWKITVFALVVYLLFTGIAFPYHAKNLKDITGKRVQILDIRLSYDKQQVLQLFDEMKPEGRKEYRFVSGVTDIIYPFVYGTIIILLISFFTKYLAIKRWWLLLGFPLLLMAFDFAENTMILRMLDQYPNLEESTVNLGSTFSFIKWSFALISVSTVVGLAILYFRNKPQSSN